MKEDERKLAVQIAGEIALAENPGVVIRKWREIFNVSQKELAKRLGTTPSVISDYESGRRKSPGVKLVAKIINALFEIDRERGGNIIRQYSKVIGGSKFYEAILAIREFIEPVTIKDVVEAVKGHVYFGEKSLGNKVYGYTVIDSIKAILELSPLELAMIYGTTTQRALVFTGVRHGRSPMLAIKLTSLKPAVVVIHGPLEEPDPLGIELAKREMIPFVVSRENEIGVKELIERLGKLGEGTGEH